jgi:hypothetical protein
MQTLEQAISEVNHLFSDAGMKPMIDRGEMMWFRPSPFIIDSQGAYPNAVVMDSESRTNFIRKKSAYDQKVAAAEEKLIAIYQGSEWFTPRYLAAEALSHSKIPEAQLDQDLRNWTLEMRQLIFDPFQQEPAMYSYAKDACRLYRHSKHESVRSLIEDLAQDINPEISNEAKIYLPKPEQNSFFSRHPYIGAAVEVAAISGAVAAIAACCYFYIKATPAPFYNIIGPL